MEVIGYIIGLAFSGLIVGALARLLLPGRDPMSLLETMLAGVGGSLIAGLIAYYVFDQDEGAAPFLIALACTIAIVYAVRKYRQKAEPQRTAPGPMTFGSGNVHTQVHFFPGCLLFSLGISLFLTIVLNLIVRAF
ncbi:MAG: hypothetical protein M3335_01380 [Actinomycetota bacterium]|nr:hypothetical protein [Actinomycetota bacterium]